MVRRLLCFLIGACAVPLSFAGTAHADERALRAEREALQAALQNVIDELTGRLKLPAQVTATLVPANPLLVSVEPGADRTSFVMSFEAGFLQGLTTDELRAIVAHELGHVWIFTHHPYLQTERLANNVALRVVSRQSLEQVYSKVWAHGGEKGDMARFLPAPE